MNSGLYAFAGDSATATLAAWAKRLLDPMTNVSNMYFGLSRLPARPAPRSSRPRRSSGDRPGPLSVPPGRLPRCPGCRCSVSSRGGSAGRPACCGAGWAGRGCCGGGPVLGAASLLLVALSLLLVALSLLLVALSPLLVALLGRRPLRLARRRGL